MRQLSGCLLVLYALSAHAEYNGGMPNNPTAAAAYGNNNGQGPATSNPGTGRGINIFNDGVFKLSTDESNKPTTSTSSGSGTVRPLADEPTINTQKRQELIEKCGSNRDCFNREKKAAEQEIQRGISGVESKQGEPLRNSVPLLEESPSSGNDYKAPGPDDR